MTMRRSPRRPLILKRRRLPFQQSDPGPDLHKAATEDASQANSSRCIPDGVCIMDHPSMASTQVVVVPKTADIQNVIGVLTAKGKECGAQGPNKFILLSGDNSNSSGSFSNIISRKNNSSSETTNGQINIQNIKLFNAIKQCKDMECGPLDNSLTNIQWLGRMSTHFVEQFPTKPLPDKEKLQVSQMLQSCNTQADSEVSLKQSLPERPPYSYMAMIQFAINSKQSRKMTLKEIYMWIEDHFPYFKEGAKPGWKNSIRHNLSLHDMFIRETSTDGKVSFWTIRPEANRCLTLDQVYKKRMMNECQSIKKTSFGSERKMKPLLPRTDSYLVPIQLPASSSVYMPPSSSSSQHKRSIVRGGKKVRIAPKVSMDDVSGMDIKEEAVEIPVNSASTKATSKQSTSSSRRKQRLVHSLHEEPLLLCHGNTFFDSGVVSDTSTFHDMPDTVLNDEENLSPNRELSFKTPIKSSNHMTSSTPSKPPCNMFPEQWKVTPVGKHRETVLDFSPIRTPGGPAVTPRHDYTTFSFSSTPFKDLPLFNSPRELLTASTSRASDFPGDCHPSGCSRELLQTTGVTPTKHSVTEGLVLDTMNDSLSKILVDISFSGLDDEDMGMANISWSEFIPQLK
ncbi:forkhead box protein M1 isoform X2 [Boleophthalmus pectinirostris]|uniref:forkhead box protein M1 isoform X2 n=1 Tax=Boleophthalmus pectinirostris TaxID=150288 RepID=UPI00242E28AA|nr:forkhead box protein M1 isoform X2 [Boleophthalmus pectinirostris]